MCVVLFVSLKELGKVDRIIEKHYHNNIHWIVYAYLREEYTDCKDNYLIKLQNNVVVKECHFLPLFPNLLISRLCSSTPWRGTYIVISSAS